MLGRNEHANFEQTVMPHLDAAYNFARWLTRNTQDAEDVAQESFLRAVRFFPGFQGGDSRAWLMKIVRNTCYTWLHANRRMQDATEFDESLFGGDPRALNPEEIVLREDNDLLVRTALEKLSRSHREVIVLRELEGMSYREIAEITGVPAGTVMSSLSRARAQLRRILMELTNGETPSDSRQPASMIS